MSCAELIVGRITKVFPPTGFSFIISVNVFGEGLTGFRSSKQTPRGKAGDEHIKNRISRAIPICFFLGTVDKRKQLSYLQRYPSLFFENNKLLFL